VNFVNFVGFVYLLNLMSPYNQMAVYG